MEEVAEAYDVEDDKRSMGNWRFGVWRRDTDGMMMAEGVSNGYGEGGVLLLDEGEEGRWIKVLLSFGDPSISLITFDLFSNYAPQLLLEGVFCTYSLHMEDSIAVTFPSHSPAIIAWLAPSLALSLSVNVVGVSAHLCCLGWS